MKVKIYKKIERVLLLCGIFLLVINYLLYQCLGIETKVTLRILSLIILLMCMIFNANNFKISTNMFWYFLSLVICMAYNPIEKLNYFFIIIFVIVTFHQDIDKVIFMLMLSAIGGIVIYFVFRIGGIVTDTVSLSRDGRIRHSLGFSNINSASALFFSNSILLLINQSKKKRYWILAIIGLLWCVFKTKTRTVIINILLFIILYVVMKKIISSKKYNRNKLKKLSLIVGIGIFCIAIISFLFPLILKYFPDLDYILSLRVSIGTRFIQKMTFSTYLLGGMSEEIDNSFLVFFSKYGFLISIWTLIIVIKAVKRLVMERNYLYLSFLITMCVNGLSESDFIRPELMANLAFWVIVFRYGFYNEKRKIKYN